MKRIKAFRKTLRSLHMSGRLNDVAAHRLDRVLTALQHAISNRDRRKAQKIFGQLCDQLSSILMQ